MPLMIKYIKNKKLYNKKTEFLATLFKNVLNSKWKKEFPQALSVKIATKLCFP